MNRVAIVNKGAEFMLVEGPQIGDDRHGTVLHAFIMKATSQLAMFTQDEPRATLCFSGEPRACRPSSASAADRQSPPNATEAKATEVPAQHSSGPSETSNR